MKDIEEGSVFVLIALALLMEPPVAKLILLTLVILLEYIFRPVWTLRE